MQSYEQIIEEWSDNRLVKELKTLEKNERKISKSLPDIKKNKKEQKIKEYNEINERIEIIKALMKKREEEQTTVEESTAEKLFPTVTKIVQDNKVASTMKEEAALEKKKELKEAIKNEIREELKEELRKELESATIETIETKDTKTTEEKYDDIVLEFVENKGITEEKQEKPKRDVPKEKPIIEPVRPQTILQEIKADGSIEQIVLNSSPKSNISKDFGSSNTFNNELDIEDILNIDDMADSRTMVLKSTKQDIIERPVTIITDDYIKDISDEDAKRDLELTIVSRDIIKEKMREKNIEIELETELSNKLDILNKNINKLRLRIK